MLKSEVAWSGAEQALRGLLVNDGLLVNAIIVAAVLVGKEFFLRSKSLTLAINTLAVAVSLATWPSTSQSM